MRILQAGYRKSGNYWLWRIIQETLAAAEMPRESFIRREPIYEVARTWKLSFPEQAGVDMIAWEGQHFNHLVIPMFHRRIGDLAAYVSRTHHVWTHDPWHRGMPALCRHFDKVVYIVRDPRDIVVSLADFQKTAFTRQEAFDDLPPPEIPGDRHGSDWSQHVAGWLIHRAASGAHVVHYERLVGDFDGEYAALLAYLGIELDDGRRRRVAQAVSFGSMASAGPHVNRGQVGRWAEAMPPATCERAIDAWRELLELLGYPLSVEHARSTELPPAVPVCLPPSWSAVLSDYLSPGTPPPAAPVAGAALGPRDRLRSTDPEMAYRVDRSPDDTVSLYHRNGKITLPGDSLSFAIRLATTDEFDAADAVEWFAPSAGYDWPAVHEILAFLLAHRVVVRVRSSLDPSSP